MTGLKIVKKDRSGGPTVDICPDGYIKVTETIILSEIGFNDFVNGGNGTTHQAERAQALQDIVTNGAPDCVVTTLTKDIAISSANCHVRANPDKDHKAGKVAHHSIPMPPEFISTGLGYLDEYIQALLQLWATDQDAARKFLYGVMMLTKCR